MEMAANVTVLLAALALWSRRRTWVPWEKAATLNVGLQTVYSLVLLPSINFPISHWLHRLTGQWNLEELFGIFCYLGAQCSLTYMFASRLNWTPTQFRRFIQQRIELPATLFIPALIGTFIATDCGNLYVPCLYRVHLIEHPGIGFFFLLTSAAVLWLLGHTIWALLIILRDDKRSTQVCYAYLGAISVTLVCVALFAAAPLMLKHVPDLRWLAVRVELAAYAVAATYSWNRKKRTLGFDLWRQIAKGQAKRPEVTPQG